MDSRLAVPGGIRSLPNKRQSNLFFRNEIYQNGLRQNPRICLEGLSKTTRSDDHYIVVDVSKWRIDMEMMTM
jgi:hypothetical protein